MNPTQESKKRKCVRYSLHYGDKVYKIPGEIDIGNTDDCYYYPHKNQRELVIKIKGIKTLVIEPTYIWGRIGSFACWIDYNTGEPVEDRKVYEKDYEEE